MFQMRPCTCCDTVPPAQEEVREFHSNRDLLGLAREWRRENPRRLFSQGVCCAGQDDVSESQLGEGHGKAGLVDPITAHIWGFIGELPTQVLHLLHLNLHLNLPLCLHLHLHPGPYTCPPPAPAPALHQPLHLPSTRP